MADDSTEYLLRIMRVSGVFKCTECMYCKPMATELGNLYKCVRDGAALHGYEKTRREVMQGSACCNFYPRPMAGEAVALRQSAIMTGTRALIELAEDEGQLARTLDTLYDLGV